MIHMTDDEHRRMIVALEKSDEPGYRVPGYQTERVREYLAIPVSWRNCIGGSRSASSKRTLAPMGQAVDGSGSPLNE
jgi:hypothetical protein